MKKIKAISPRSQTKILLQEDPYEKENIVIRIRFDANFTHHGVSYVDRLRHRTNKGTYQNRRS